MTHVFSHEAQFAASRDALHAYYTNPGTVRRLTPDWSATIVQEPRSLEPGNTTTLRLGWPWLPRIAGQQPGATWVAKHTEYHPGQGFVDEQVRGPFRSWVHRHEFSGEEHTTVRDTITYDPGILGVGQSTITRELERIFAYRTRQTAADLDFQATLRELDPEPKTFVIAGASGLVGTALSAFLRSQGHQIIALTRNAHTPTTPGVRTVQWDPSRGLVDATALRGAHAVINLAGHSILGRFNEQHKKKIYYSRIHSTDTLVRALAEPDMPRVLINASASGIYGSGTTDTKHEFLAHVCRDWEASALRAEAHGVRVACIRTGLVTTARGGILGAQLPLYLAGLGGKLGSGQMWQPWISLEDLIRIYAFAALNPALAASIDAAAPNPVRQATFAKTLADLLHRPHLLTTPSLAVSAVLGPQGARELALSSVRMEPTQLASLGYEFRFAELGNALAHTLGTFSS